MSVRFLPALFLLGLTPLPQPAGLPANASRPRIHVSSAQPASPEQTAGDTEARIAALLDEALVNEFRALGFAVSQDGDEPSKRPDAVEFTISSRFIIAGSRMTLVMTVRDPETNLVLGGGSFVGTPDLGLMNTVRVAAAEIGLQIRSVAAVLEPPPVPPRVLQTLTLYSADEGALVKLGDNTPLGRIHDGKLEAPFLPFALGSQLPLRTHLDGYHSVWHSITITDENMEVHLPSLRPRVNWEMQLSWMTQRWAGLALGFRRYLLPEQLYLQSTNQLSSRYRFAAGSQPSAVFDTRLSLGGYPITALNGRIRLGLSSGAGITFTLLRGEETAYYFADPYLKPLSLAVRRQFGRFAVFIEGDLVYYGQTKSGYLVRGTHGYFSVGVLIPCRP